MRLCWLFISVLMVVSVLACASEEHAGFGQSSSTMSSSEPTSVGPTSPTEPTGTGTSDPGSTSSTTGGDEVSTGAADSSTAEAPFCGDGLVGPGEQCDDGLAANTENSACLPTCESNVCGDGFVHAGVEQCDFGDENSYDFGGCIPGTCFWGPRCGDGEVTPGHELCDPGAPVDPMDGEIVPCGQDCRYNGRIVFLSSELYDGDLGGVSGADLKCQTLAKAFDPDRYYTYRAWLSDGTSDPNMTFEHGPTFADTPYALLSGVLVAASFDDLVQNGPAVGITITDTYQAVIKAFVWTHTTHAGWKIPDDHHCEQWTADDFSHVAMTGWNALPEDSPDLQTWIDERWWTRYAEDFCQTARHLYCFEN
jgi:hypothetical protein